MSLRRRKGQKKAVVRKKIDIKDYKEWLLEQNEKILPQNNIISNKHNLYSNTTTKIALSANDNKRFVCEDRITTLPWWHYAIMETM